MTTLISRIQNKLFRAITECRIDKHAGGFFIHKTALFVMVNNENKLSFIEVDTGGRPYEIEKENAVTQLESEFANNYFELIKSSDNMCSFKENANTATIYLSAIEEILAEREITEIALEMPERNIIILSAL